MKLERKLAGCVLFAVFAAACVAIYWSGLYGSFIYDDSTFLLDNTAIRVTSLKFADWVAAAMSFPSGVHQGRWLGMVSFAANYYFTGLDPFWLKFTNLAIHVCNGLLVFLMLRALLAWWRECRPEVARSTAIDAGLAAAVLAGLWLVLPINLTAVLYISQRLESLSNTFVFLGLWLYFRARLRHWQGREGPLGMWLSLMACTAVGVLVKESAAMLPLYAACAEFAISAFRARDGKWSKPVLALYGVLLGVPLIIGACWLASWLGGQRSYARPFDTIQRVLTEGRIMFDYVRWTVAPSLDSLTLYHDDIALSRNLLDPPTTLAALLAIVAIVGIALWKRARYPLAALGVLWFFAGHLLTGTVIPLLLAFEHRNYFSSIGVLLTGASLITLEGGLRNPRVRILASACLLAFYGLTTWMRAQEWSDALRLTMSEAAKRPDSPGAQYELGRTLIFATRAGDDAPLRDQGIAVLANGAKLPGAPILFEQLLIVTSAVAKQPADPAWWSALAQKLQANPPSSPDIEALRKLLRCFEKKVCTENVDDLARVYATAVGRPDTSAVLRTQYAQFAMDFLHDDALAELQIRAAIDHSPTDVTSRDNLITFLIRRGRFDDARAALDDLRKLNRFGSLDGKIAELDTALAEARSPNANEASPRPSDAADADEERLPLP
jgi:hypothetical protein